MSAPTASSSTSSAPALPSPFTFDPVESAIEAIGRGEFVVVMDDESRENEGDVVCAASKVTTEGMAWLVRHSSGFVCLSLPAPRLADLQLPPLLPLSGISQDPKGTAYHLTVDSNPRAPVRSSTSSSSSALSTPATDAAAASGAAAPTPGHPVTTGISAHDRAYTARLLADPSSTHSDFTRPGHLVTLRYTPGGTRRRRGHTEAATDLCYLASLPPAGLLCELTKPDDPSGSMARRDDCWRFARTWGLKCISVADLAEYVERHGEGRVPSAETYE